MKAQVATEYLVVAGLVILIMIPITYIYVKYSNESDYSITTAKVSSIANEISKKANEVYVYGEGNQLVIDTNFPENIESISFNNKEVIFKIRNKEGKIIDIVKQAEVNLFSYGEIPLTQGKKKIVVKSLGDSVLVQIPCEDNNLECKTPESYKACKGSSCQLKCENSVWIIEKTCSDANCECT